MVQLLSNEAAAGRLQLEGPQEVGHFLEIGAGSVDLVDNILNALNTVLANASLDNLVAAERDSLAGDLAVAALVYQSSDGLQVGVAVSNEGLHQSQHLLSGGVDANEHTIVDLAKSEQLQDLLDLGGQADDTTNANNEHDLVLRGNEDLSIGLGLSAAVNGLLVQLQCIPGHRKLIRTTSQHHFDNSTKMI
jgi:hypothetical protein